MNEEIALRKNIGKKIKLARVKSNFTQEKLAEKTSLSARYISQLERGLAFGSASTIVNICKALDINSDFLFSDLINSNTTPTDNFIDTKFLEVYIKLDDKNKEILNAIANQLLKLQKEDIIAKAQYNEKKQ